MSNRAQHPVRRIELRGALLTETQACFDALAKTWGAMTFACLTTADGRLVAWVGSKSQADAQRQAAMTSSLIALSESFAKDALRSTCTHSMIATLHGVIISVRVPSAVRAFVLSVGADTSDVAAMALRISLDTADKIARIVDAAS